MRKACDQLLEKEPHILEKTLATLEDSLVIRRAIHDGKTAQEIYEATWTTWTVQTKIHINYPQPFELIKQSYLPKIQAIKKKLQKM